MFENLRKKLKKAIRGISKKIDEPEQEVKEIEDIIDSEEQIDSETPEPDKTETQEEESIVEPEEPEPTEPEPEQAVEEPEPEQVVEEVTKEEPIIESQPIEEIKEPEPEPEPAPAEEKPKPEPEVEPEKVIESPKPEPEPEVEEPESGLTTSEETLIQEAEKEAEAEFQKHKEILEKQGEGFFKKLIKRKGPKSKSPELQESHSPEIRPTLMERLRKRKISEKDLDGILWDLELALIENDVAKEVTEKLTEQVKKDLLGAETSRKEVEALILDSLKSSVTEILDKEQPDIIQKIKNNSGKPYTILFFGFNGTGKTMTIGKFAKLLKDNGLSCVMAAGDTFRAAAIEQLQVHATKMDVPIIKQERGSDAAAVIFDAIDHAKAKGIDVVLADTAGRSDTNTNLMDELKKVVRVNSPDLKVFVGDALTGNDAADQAKVFHDAVGIDVAVLTKVDCDAKGGSCLSVSYMADAPIVYLGTGQGYADMEPFKPEWFIDKVF